MTFPVLIPLGGWRVHPHVFFEVLAYAVAAGVFLWLRRRRGDPLSGADRLSLVTAIIPFDTYNLFYRDGLETKVLQPLRVERRI